MVVYLVLEVRQYLDGSLPQMLSCALREIFAARLVSISFDYYHFYLWDSLLAFLKEYFFILISRIDHKLERIKSLTFISLGTGFGTNAASSFSGPKPAFGSANTSGSGIFGNTASTTGGTGFGGFGSNNTNTSSPFGSNNASTGTGLFGSTSKPTFGTGNTTGTNPFGGGTTGGSFGQNNTSTGAFGAPQSTALGATTNSSDCQGTGTTPFSAFSEKESPNSTATNVYQSISFMLPYQKFSFEVSRGESHVMHKLIN